MTRLAERPRTGRRSFLKLAAGLGAAGLARPTLAAAAPLAIASAWPLPFPHRRLANPLALLADPAGPLPAAGLLLPADVAAGLIQQGRLRPLAGPPGRAHDPDGAFTIPYTYTVSVLAGAGGAPRAWADLWAAGAAARWPADARLVIGLALRRLGYSPNDGHPGHLALARAELLKLRPRLAADPLADLRAGRAQAACLAVEAAVLAAMQQQAPGALALPAEGALLTEYDWVLPAHPLAGDAGAAASTADFLARLAPPPLPPAFDVPLIPLAPLPPAALAQHAELWRALSV